MVLFWDSKVNGHRVNNTIHNNTSFPTTIAIDSHSLGGDQYYNVTTALRCHSLFSRWRY